MEWLEIASKLTLNAALLGGLVVVWRRWEKTQAKLDAAQEARIDDLKTVLLKAMTRQDD